MTKSLVESISQEQEEFYLENLNLIEKALKLYITSYAIEDSENLFDERSHCIVRKVVFSVGLKSHILVFYPSGHIKAVDNKMPRRLMLAIFECLTDLILQDDIARFSYLDDYAESLEVTKSHEAAKTI